MTNLPSSLTASRLLLPETIWLEPEQMEQAKTMSERAISETQQWESYLNALALLAFEQWLSDRLPEYAITRSLKPIELVSYIEVNGFTVCLLAVEHMLDETVRLSQVVVEQPALAAHFYVVHEVSEEQALVTVRGFCRYDELSRNVCSARPDGSPIYQSNVTPPKTAGILSLKLPATVAPLVVDKRYHWFFKLYCRSISPPDSFVDGWIQREALTSDLTQKLKTATLPQQVRLYAANGFWFDALMTAAELRRTNSGDAAWAELLKAIGLETVAVEAIITP